MGREVWYLKKKTESETFEWLCNGWLGKIVSTLGKAKYLGCRTGCNPFYPNTSLVFVYGHPCYSHFKNFPGVWGSCVTPLRGLPKGRLVLLSLMLRKRPMVMMTMTVMMKGRLPVEFVSGYLGHGQFLVSQNLVHMLCDYYGHAMWMGALNSYHYMRLRFLTMIMSRAGLVKEKGRQRRRIQRFDVPLKQAREIILHDMLCDCYPSSHLKTH